jgi:hypothetical protein
MAIINDKIVKIRTATYGEEVRDAIADGIDSINKEVESTTARQDAVDVNENERIENENERKTSEDSRKTAENGRVVEFSSWRDLLKNGIKLKTLGYSKIATVSNQSRFEIDDVSFDIGMDSVMVFKNSIFIGGENYTVSPIVYNADGSTTKAGINFDSTITPDIVVGTEIYIVVFKNVPYEKDESMKFSAVSRHDTKYIATTDTTHIAINNDLYNPDTDILDVILKGTTLEKDYEYALNADKTIDLIGWTLLNGESLIFRVLKNVLPYEVQFDGALVKVDSMPMDRVQGLSASLAENVQQINNLQNNKADKTEVNSLASNKADTTYVDTKVASVASGSPKGTYATLTDLQTAYPTGTTGIYLVTADGKWYYWDGSAWTAGGTYQSTGIGDGTVKLTSLTSNAKKAVLKNVPLTQNNQKIGFYNNSTRSDDSSYLTKYYDVSKVDKIYITGTFSAYVNIYTLFDESGNIISYQRSSTDNNAISNMAIDCSNAASVAISSATGNFYNKPYTIFGDVYSFYDTDNQQKNVDKIKNDMYELLELKETSTKDGFYNSSYVFVQDAALFTKVFDVSEYDSVILSGHFSPYNYSYILYDESMNVISSQYLKSVTDFALELDTKSAKSLYVTTSKQTGYWDVTTVKANIPKNKMGFWYDKKIVWFGTSIPAGGYSGLETEHNYPKMVGEILGANVINEAIGSSPAHQFSNDYITSENPLGYCRDWIPASRCLSNSLAEAQYILDNYNSGIFNKNVPGSITPELTASVLDCSYENKLDRHLGDGNRADIYIFDHGYNDYMLAEDDFSDNDPYNKYTFKGAMNFLINRILSDNPNAKIVMISHYTNQNLQVYQGDLLRIEEDVADTWQLPICKLYEKLGWSSKYKITTTMDWNADGYLVDTGVQRQATVFSLWVKDGIHPHTDASYKALDYIAENIAAWLDSDVRKTLL